MHGTVKRKNKTPMREKLASSEALRVTLSRELQNARAANDRLVSNHQSAMDRIRNEERRRELEADDHHEMLQKEIYRLTTAQEALRVENWQLKGALGYSVPGHIREGDFKCGLCEAKTNATLEMERRWDECTAKLKDFDEQRIKLAFAIDLLKR